MSCIVRLHIETKNSLFQLFFFVLTSTGEDGAQTLCIKTHDCASLGLGGWVLALTRLNGMFLASFKTNIWLAAVPKLYGALKACVKTETGCNLRLSVEPELFPMLSSLPPLFCLHTAFVFYSQANFSCFVHNDLVGLVCFSSEWNRKNHEL